MKVTLNWLKEYVHFSWSPEQLAERLTMLGIEVEGVEKVGGGFEGVVVAQILASEKHPNADKLSVCRVADGQGERQIVCGAKNFQVGDKVPLALPGTTLPTPAGQPPFTIKVGKIRNVESHGMMCSPKELGLAEDAQGLMILPPDAKVGQAFADHLGQGEPDVVYDLEITPNRPDLNSVVGIAREISALTGKPLKLPAISLPAPAPADPPNPVDKYVLVRIADAELCPRYTARVIGDIKVGPSPDWLKQKLEKVGIRSINNVVDVTNFVMLEIGQPLHAFDYRLLIPLGGADAAREILIRRAQSGEEFVTLDGQKRTLTENMLVIADSRRAIALAGIMGGQDSEINDQTSVVLIESANFKQQNIRATSKALDLRTESSYRFERGADVGICDWASQRAAQLILETAGGKLAAGAIDAFPNPPDPRQINMRHARAKQILGIEIPTADAAQHFRQLGLDVLKENTDGVCTVVAPTFRVDLKSEIDLIEELVRLHGVDKVPSTPPRGAVGSHAFDGVFDQLASFRSILRGLGLNEAQGQTLISDAVAAKLLGPGEFVRLANPLSSDMNVLRPSLLPGLIEALSRNVHHKTNDIALFEAGRIFSSGKTGPQEELRVAIALTGHRSSGFWTGEERNAKYDIYDLKGIIEELFEHFGIRGATYAAQSERCPLFLESGNVILGKYSLGTFGQLSPLVARQYDLRDPVLLAELNLDLLLARRNPSKSFKPLPQLPAIRRDVAVLVPEATTHDAILTVVRQTKPANLENVELFDVFHGANLPAGQKSMAYAFTYRSNERTLTDGEVNAAHEVLLDALKTKLDATIR